MLALGIVGAPLLDGCASDPRGVVTCLRDMADRKFNLPGEPQGKAAEVAPHAVRGIAPPDTSVEVPDAELAPTASPTQGEAQDVVVASPSPLRLGGSGGGPPLPIPRPERTAYVTVVPATQQPVAPPAIAETTKPAEAAGQGGPLIAAMPPAQAPASETADLAALDAPATTMPTPSANAADEPASVAEKANPPDRQASIPSVIDPPLDGASEFPAPEVEPLAEQPASAPPVSVPATVTPPMDIATSPAPVKVGPPGKQPGSVPPRAVAPSEAPTAAATAPEPPPTTLASIEPVDPLPEPVTAAPIALAPTIDAIELEGDASYISGSGPADALIRLSADGQLIGESQVEEGRWIVEAGALLATPRRELRVEAIEPQTGKLLGQAVITVEIELPKNPPASAPSNTPDTQGETATPQDLAAAPTADPVQAADAQLPPTPPEPAASEVASPAQPEPTGDEPFATSEQDVQDLVLPDALPMPAEEEATALDEPAAEPSTVEEPSTATEADTLPELLPVKPRGETDSVTILPAPSDDQSSTVNVEEPTTPALVATFELPAPASGSPVTILRLVPFGDPVNGRFTGGKAIIRDGDTLWTVAHRYYGSGRHYRTIFKANRDLIRRPSRIFPGQVLDLPLVTEE